MTKIRIVVYSILLMIVLNMVQPFEKTSIDPEVKAYYNKYMAVVNQYCTKDQYFHPEIKIQIKELENPIIGLCISLPNRFSIYLDKKFWNEESDIDRMVLVAHELTHCMFDQGHVDKRNHYMASEFNYLTLEELYSQMIQLFKEKCGQQ